MIGFENLLSVVKSLPQCLVLRQKTAVQICEALLTLQCQFQLLVFELIDINLVPLLLQAGFNLIAVPAPYAPYETVDQLLILFQQIEQRQ